MTRVGKQSKFTLSKFLGVVFMPLLAGALLGYTAAYFLYSGLINNIEQECLSQVDIEYGHPITLDCFFTKIPPNTKFITNVSQIDTGMLASYDIAIDCGAYFGGKISSLLAESLGTGFINLFGLPIQVQAKLNKKFSK